MDLARFTRVDSITSRLDPHGTMRVPVIITLATVGTLLFYQHDAWLFAPFFAFMLFGLVNSLFPAKK
jgi:hypothetical protein